MLGFINAPVDRAAGFRQDHTWLTSQLKNAHTRFVVFVGDRPVIDIRNESARIMYMSPDQISKYSDLAEPVLLNANGAPSAVFAVQIAQSHEEHFNEGETRLIDLRSLAMQNVLPDGDTGLLAQARSMLSWHENHRFCAGCGSKTDFADAGFRRHCSACRRDHFPRVDPVVIMLIKHKNQYLLGRGHNFKQGSYSALAGFVEPGETLEAAVQRETLEETGVLVGEVNYLMSQPWPFPSTLMIGAIGDALSTQLRLDENEIEDARWFGVEEIKQMIAQTHARGFCLPPAMSIAHQMLVGEIARLAD